MHGRSEIVLLLLIIIHLEFAVFILDDHIEVLSLGVFPLDNINLEPDQAMVRVDVEIKLHGFIQAVPDINGNSLVDKFIT